MSCCAATLTSPEYLDEAAKKVALVEQERVIAESADLGGGRYKTELIVPSMHCVGCIGTIERELAQFPLVEQVRANLSLKSVSICWRSDKGKFRQVIDKLEALGFESHLADSNAHHDEADKTNRSLLLALAVAGFAAANIMLLSVSVWSGADEATARLFHLISGIIAVPTVAFAGRPFFDSAIKSLTAGRLNMDVPISLAVLLALGMSIFESLTGGDEAYFDASVTLLFFLLIGRYLDALMRKRARGAVDRLASLSAKSGVLIEKDGSLGHVELSDIRPGMHLRIFTGERFPVNCKIMTGNTEVDRSHVTGEAVPVLVKPGAIVESGALNISAPVDVEATSDANSSFLAEIRNMVEAAEQGRGSFVRIADKMAQIYAPAVHLLALVAFVFWMFMSGGDWHMSLYTAITVLIITCPCALGLAVPVAHVIGANRLLSQGILLRDGTALERLSEVDQVVFDKTGTLTNSGISVSRSENFQPAHLPIVKALASTSRHPLSEAINKSLGAIKPVELKQIHEVPGSGIEANYQGVQVRFGRADWVGEIAKEPELSTDENWSVAFAIAGQSLEGFNSTEELREDAAVAVRCLEQDDLPTMVLSGDRQSAVRRLAKTLGITSYLAGQKPSDKINQIEAIKAEGHKPLMVGDGINDAPALTAGHVSMVPASASDIGRHAADLVFVRSSLLAVPYAIETAKRTQTIVFQNFGLAIAYNCIAIPLAMAGMVTPLIAAIAMSASSILVVANSLRINFGEARQLKRLSIAELVAPDQPKLAETNG